VDERGLPDPAIPEDEDDDGTHGQSGAISRGYSGLAALWPEAARPDTPYSGAIMLLTPHSGRFYEQWERSLSYGTSLLYLEKLWNSERVMEIIVDI
jgi:hypothetical protein